MIGKSTLPRSADTLDLSAKHFILCEIRMTWRYRTVHVWAGYHIFFALKTYLNL